MNKLKIKTSSAGSLLFLSIFLFIVLMILVFILLLKGSFTLFPPQIAEPAIYKFPSGEEAKYDPEYFTPEEAEEVGKSFEHVEQ